MLLTSSDTKRTLMHLFLFTNSAQEKTGFNMYAEYTQLQSTFFALVPCSQLNYTIVPWIVLLNYTIVPWIVLLNYTIVPWIVLLNYTIVPWIVLLKIRNTKTTLLNSLIYLKCNWILKINKFIKRAWQNKFLLVLCKCFSRASLLFYFIIFYLTLNWIANWIT